jgi:hypothetical protein
MVTSPSAYWIWAADKGRRAQSVKRELLSTLAPASLLTRVS